MAVLPALLLLSLCVLPVPATYYDGCFSLYAYEDENYISSEGYPHQRYSNNYYRCWSIIASEPNSNIIVEIEFFATEDCCDYVNIYADGDGGDPLAKWKGDLPAGTSVTSPDRIIFEFATDYTVQDVGFQFSYRQESNCPCQHLTATYSEQRLFTPNYPSPYPANHEECWAIETEDHDHNVLVEVVHFDTEHGYDQLEIYEGHEVDEEWKELWEGSLSEEAYGRSLGGSITLRFRSDGGYQTQGFALSYRQISMWESWPEWTWDWDWNGNPTDDSWSEWGTHVVDYSWNHWGDWDYDHFSYAPVIGGLVSLVVFVVTFIVLIIMCKKEKSTDCDSA